MPRTAREVEDDVVYHVHNRGNADQRVFQKDADYLAFLKLVEEIKSVHGIDIYAYCLMPDHFHLLVKAVRGEDLSRGMHWLMTTHVRRYHQHYRSKGHLWQGRFKSLKVAGDEEFLTLTRYIEGNPVRAGLVDTAQNWVWSSHRGRCGLQSDALIEALPGSQAATWTRYVDTPLTASELARVRKKRVAGL